MKTIVVILLFVLAPAIASAQAPRTPFFESSAKLGDACTSEEISLVLNCVRYVVAVQDTISTMRAMGFLQADQVPFCIPEKATAVDITAAVKKYYAENPMERSKGQQVFAPVTVMVALVKAFPCAKK
jgi:hypothetical protein